MATFKGHKTGFKPGDSNETTPRGMMAPDTDFKGRGAVPGGKLQRYPAGAADTSGGNRRLAKSDNGDGGGSGVSYRGRGGFGK